MYIYIYIYTYIYIYIYIAREIKRGKEREQERERERYRKGLAALFAAADAVEWGEHVVVVAGLVILHAARVVGRLHVVVTGRVCACMREECDWTRGALHQSSARTVRRTSRAILSRAPARYCSLPCTYSQALESSAPKALLGAFMLL
jgi:hypothetical protein